MLSLFNTQLSYCTEVQEVQQVVNVIMAALWNRAGHYVFALWFLSFFFFFLVLFFLA